MSKVKELYPTMKIETDRLIIRPFEMSDSDGCFGFLSNREDCYNDGGYEPFTEMDEEYGMLMDKFNNQHLRKIIVDKETNEVLGTINVMEVDDRAVEAYELGYTICHSKQKKGYGFEAVSKVCDLLLHELDAELLLAGAIESNVPSLKMIEKLRFEYEGRRHKAFYHPVEGKVDLLYFYLE